MKTAQAILFVLGAERVEKLSSSRPNANLSSKLLKVRGKALSSGTFSKPGKAGIEKSLCPQDLELEIGDDGLIEEELEELLFELLEPCGLSMVFLKIACCIVG